MFLISTALSFFSLLVIGWGWGLLVWHSYQRKVQVKECSLLVDVEINNGIEGESFPFLFYFFFLLFFEEGGVIYLFEENEDKVMVNKICSYE